MRGLLKFVEQKPFYQTLFHPLFKASLSHSLLNFTSGGRCCTNYKNLVISTDFAFLFCFRASSRLMWTVNRRTVRGTLPVCKQNSDSLISTFIRTVRVGQPARVNKTWNLRRTVREIKDAEYHGTVRRTVRPRKRRVRHTVLSLSESRGVGTETNLFCSRTFQAQLANQHPRSPPLGSNERQDAGIQSFEIKKIRSHGRMNSGYISVVCFKGLMAKIICVSLLKTSHSARKWLCIRRCNHFPCHCFNNAPNF